MKKLLIILVLLLSVVSFSQAQRKKPKNSVTFAENIITNYTDSLAQLRACYDSTWSYQGNDLLVNPYYYRLFVQPTFYFNPVRQAMDLIWKEDTTNTNQDYLLVNNKTDNNLKVNTALNRFFMDLYTHDPQYIVTSQTIIDQNEGLRTDLPHTVKHEVSLSNIIKPTQPALVVEPVQVISHRPNFWTLSHTYSLQLIQNYISDNWYKGGNSNNSFLATGYITANYNNKSKIIFENSLDIKLGFQTVKSDTVHKFQSTTDLLRMINKLGLRASKHWYYTFLLQSWTQMTPQFPTNSNTAYSDFMSPFESVFSVGMEYKLSIQKFSVSATIAPFSYDLKYVARTRLETRYGNLANHHLREYYGSNITVNYSWQILNELKWSARMYYFTNYNKVQFEWENTFNFTINKYLSTTFFVYPRFDDTEYDKQRNHRIQLKEYLSLGFNYAF